MVNKSFDNRPQNYGSVGKKYNIQLYKSHYGTIKLIFIWITETTLIIIIVSKKCKKA